MTLIRRHSLAIALVALILFPPFAQAVGNPFLVSTATRILIFGLAAASLDFILGYAGLVSFGHAAFFSIGSYIVGILSYHAFDGSPVLTWPWHMDGTDLALVAWPAAMAAAAIAALVIGALSLRAEGVFFIMITLAFAQMIYFTSLSLPEYGGDDGLNIAARNSLPWLDLSDDRVFYYLCLAILMGFLALCRMLARSRFGMVLRGCKQNERRTRALGIRTYPYKLAAFVFAGAAAGLAGALMANQTLFVSAHSLDWKVSGDLMVMVILGGIGTLYGPVIGAAIFLVLSEFLGVQSLFGNLAEHWQLVFGCLLVLVVMFAPRGVLGWIARGRHV